MNKKAALELSVNAIIIFVLAFAMLGVGLTVTNMLSKKVEEGVGIIDVTELVIDEPSSQDPITLPNKIDLRRGKQAELQVGYYNTASDMAFSATMGIAKCLDTETTLVPTENLPTVVSSSEDVAASDSSGYKIVIRENSVLDAGTYVCTMVVYNGEQFQGENAAVYAYDARNDPAMTAIYESDSFFLNVVS